MRELGLVLVFCGPFLIGLFTALKESAVLKRERGMLMLMLHGEEKIRHSLCPRDELFLDFQNEALFRCGFLSALRAKTGESPEKILEAHREALGLDGRIYACCQRYFSRLGKLDYEGQLAHCRQCREEAEEGLRERESKGRDRIKLSITLGAAAGAFAVIVLL